MIPIVLVCHGLDAIRSLQRNGRPDFLARLIDQYVVSSTEHAVPIRRAMASEDASALWQAVHALISGSGMMGASMFAELCHELEALGRAATLVRIPDVLSQLEASYSERVRGSRRRSGQRTLIWNLKENERRRWL